MTTILLADDHHVLREALRVLLETQSDLKVIAETGDGLEAVRLTAAHQPDVLIVDMVMPSLLGIEVARRAKSASPFTHVIVLSMYDTEAYVAESLQAGAIGYVLKKSSSKELIFAIRQALAGIPYLSPPLNERSVQAYMQRTADSGTSDPLDTLTAREREIFQLVSEGLSSPQVAEKLLIGTRTVETHRANLMKKLGLRSQIELVKYAMRHGELLE